MHSKPGVSKLFWLADPFCFFIETIVEPINQRLCLKFEMQFCKFPRLKFCFAVHNSLGNQTVVLNLPRCFEKSLDPSILRMLEINVPAELNRKKAIELSGFHRFHA